MGEGLRRLLSLIVLSAPVLEKLAIHIRLHPYINELFGKIDLAALDRMIGKSPGLAQVLFEVDEWHGGRAKCKEFANRVRDLLPITRERGTLQIRTPDGDEVRDYVIYHLQSD